MTAQWNNPRDVGERIYIQGRLKLDTPTHLGCGDAEGLLDMSLMRDEHSGGILLTGSSLAGALRGYLVNLGEYSDLAKRLFGDVTKDKSFESRLIIDDAISEDTGLEVRDGVAISAASGTALDRAKYDIELLSAGSTFIIGFELLVPKEGGEEYIRTLAIALKGLELGEISLGKRKRRGFGRCSVSGWKVTRFPMGTPGELVNWLESWPLGDLSNEKPNIDQLLLGEKLAPIRLTSALTIKAEFSLASPLMIRSTPEVEWDGQNKKVAEAPDMVHLHSRRKNSLHPVVSGTSLAGVLRSRAVRICNLLGVDAEDYVDGMFGSRRPETVKKLEESSEESTTSPKKKQDWHASRLWVDETELTGPMEADQVQSRVMIDRFTGGAHSGALFSEQPVYPLDGSRLTINMKLDPVVKKGEIGLLILLLKDLWTGDLPLGGESGVGRGRLKGISAEIAYSGKHWTITSGSDDALLISEDRKELEGYLEALKKGE